MTLENAARLAQMRHQHGYSQEELAEKLGVSRQAVSKWERAESAPDTDILSLKLLVKICSPDWLITLIAVLSCPVPLAQSIPM